MSDLNELVGAAVAAWNTGADLDDRAFRELETAHPGAVRLFDAFHVRRRIEAGEVRMILTVLSTAPAADPTPGEALGVKSELTDPTP